MSFPLTPPAPAPSGPLPFILCIVGPTGAGKTAAALALAEVLPISVINADSRQIYRDFPIITAQPSAGERARCPHLLYGFLPTREKLGAGEYSRLAASAVNSETARGRLPALVGGTGLYVKALIEGMAPIPEVAPDIRTLWQRRYAEEGGPALHAFLAGKDPAYASKIHPHDRQRITRALEVWQATGKNLSCWHAGPLPPAPYRVAKISLELPLAELEPLLQKRMEGMLRNGAEDEAREALRRCPDPEAPGWSGVGCGELRAYVEGSLSLTDCKNLWLKNTRAYAKRQLTWFRADKELVRFRPDRPEELVRHLVRMRREYAGISCPGGLA
ncbi:MAG: tRNA (adenosine(37)-N6)-dimethylallyltransferase MiaA [Desulfovibrio sp.]|jgi:tRNA dimethylallyltransferase|nr:tRNA (adenosine(37)-N6)-dimethylallyltransferase MiaA [Desulfovibrio sp.]